MSSEKDHLGRKLHDKEKGEEDRFFAEQSRKQIEKLREKHAAAAAAGKADCPRCGAPLEVKQRNGIALDGCSKGCGLWLDRGELEEITRREGDSWLARLILGSPR